MVRIIERIILKINPAKYWKRRGLIIGEGCEIYPSACFGSEPYLIEIGNHVRVNSGVQFFTHDGGVWVLREYAEIADKDKIDLFGQIKIGNNVHIGTNAIIMPGVTIGNNCIIGCGSIVTKNIGSNSVAAGIPARVIESLDEYLKKNFMNFEYTKHLSPSYKKEYLVKKYGINEKSSLH